MRIVGIMPVRNEDWVLGLSARAALMWCDALVILDHSSIDDTGDIIYDIQQEYPHRIHDLYRHDTLWDEMEHRQYLLNVARSAGATHIAIIDADEVLTGNLLPYPDVDPMREIISTMPSGQILQLPGYNLRGGIDQYHANGLWGKRWFSVVFKDYPLLGWSGDRFHHREPMGMGFNPYRPIPQDNSGVMHLWGASERRLRAKHAWYKVTERLRFPNKPIPAINQQYSQAIYPEPARREDWMYQPVPAHWWAPYAHLQQYLHVDAVPWQEHAVKVEVAKHGAALFAGLDLFGVA